MCPNRPNPVSDPDPRPSPHRRLPTLGARHVLPGGRPPPAPTEPTKTPNRQRHPDRQKITAEVDMWTVSETEGLDTSAVSAGRPVTHGTTPEDATGVPARVSTPTTPMARGEKVYVLFSSSYVCLYTSFLFVLLFGPCSHPVPGGSLGGLGGSGAPHSPKPRGTVRSKELHLRDTGDSVRAGPCGDTRHLQVDSPSAYQAPQGSSPSRTSTPRARVRYPSGSGIYLRAFGSLPWF